MKNVVLVDGVRTPFTKSGSKYRHTPAYELGRVVASKLLDRNQIDPHDVDEVIFGCTGNPPEAANISRVIALQAGLPDTISAFSVHRNCASALEALVQGSLKIKSGEATTILAGGTENMTQMPVMYQPGLQEGLENFMKAKSLVEKFNVLRKLKLKDLKPRIAILEGLTDPFCGLNMGQTAEKLAREFGLSRQDQDAFAVTSHEKALAAIKNGNLGEEITPVFALPDYKEAVTDDVGPREGLTLDKMSKLKPYFDRKHGSVTVGNSCPITDGAAAMILMEEEKAKAAGFKPLARVVSYAFAGLEPDRMGLGPVFSSFKALQKANLKLSDMGRVELNEAFAAQVMACLEAFKSKKFCQDRLGLTEAMGEIPIEKLNVNGGAIALGHPVGATGTRLVLTLAKELKRSNQKYGLATLCIGGGQGGAMIIENLG